MILGIYYKTSVDDVRFKDVEVPVFNKLGTARLMFHFKKLDLRQPIRVYRDVGEYIDTTVGRIIFNQDVFADEEFPEIEKLRRYDITLTARICSSHCRLFRDVRQPGHREPAGPHQGISVSSSLPSLETPSLCTIKPCLTRSAISSPRPAPRSKPRNLL